VFLLLIISALAASNAVARGMEFLTFDELRSLANSAEPTADEAARLDQLLITPLIVNDTSSTVGAGQIIRIAFWNINDGLEWPMIEAALRDPREFKARVERERVVSEEKWRKAAKELEDLRSADVIILNEVDLGMPRTAYANVAGELAGALGMNYAYGVEFVELGPFSDSREYHNVDRSRYRGLHGNAVGLAATSPDMESRSASLSVWSSRQRELQLRCDGVDWSWNAEPMKRRPEPQPQP